MSDAFWFWLITGVVIALIATAKYAYRAGRDDARQEAEYNKQGYYWSEFAGHGQWRKLVNKDGDDG